MTKERGSGILLPVFSLPGEYGIGSFSKEGKRFIDFLSDSKQKYWQILPLGPTSYGDSPYQSFSTFAINPYFIDIDTLVEKGLLSSAEAELAKPDVALPKNTIDYEWLYNTRLNVIKKAYIRFKEAGSAGFAAFVQKNADWLLDYAKFMAIKKHFGDVSFDNWPEKIKNHDSVEEAKLLDELADEIDFYKYLQFEADSQWHALKEYANGKGIKIIGDIPIYVAYDSSDAWMHPELFKMDEAGNPSAVAGCPPDAFSADGQLWGNPLYDWEYHASTGFKWWCRRIEKCHELYDVIRIDHFRGFDEYYSVPAGNTTAKGGKWCKGPGMALFNAIFESLGKLDIIAEDLGYITDSVRELVRDTGFPNMKVLEFAFGGRDSGTPSEYLPHNYGTNCVVYTGTHDNETVLGWLSSIQPHELEYVRDYTDRPQASLEELAMELVRLAQSSTAKLCVIPLQDYLLLGNEARINFPSTLGGNWSWRLESSNLTEEAAKKIRWLTHLYDRD